MIKHNKLFSLEGELIGEDMEFPPNFSGINELMNSRARFWRLNGKRHRDNDLPASEFSNGTKHWYFENKLHRLHGPAIIDYYGNEEWWVHGIKCTKEQHAFLVDIMKLKGLF